jgi:carbon monoxide dehydrogenase subunit G
MAQRRFTASIVVRRPPEVVFDWVADHRHVAAALDGVQRWEPLGPATTGVGARFEVALGVSGLALHNVLVLDSWERPRRLGWHSIDGLIAQRGGWRFEPRPEGTLVMLEISYEPPGGIAGSMVAGQVEGAVRVRLDRAMRELARRVESLPD